MASMLYPLAALVFSGLVQPISCGKSSEKSSEKSRIRPRKKRSLQKTAQTFVKKFTKMVSKKLALPIAPSRPLEHSDALLMRGIFNTNTTNENPLPIQAVADLSQRHPSWWIYLPKTLAEVQKKAENLLSKAPSLQNIPLGQKKNLVAFFHQHPPKTRYGWLAYQKWAAVHPQDAKICRKNLNLFVQQASLNQFKDLYPAASTLRITQEMWAQTIHRMILSGNQKDFRDVSGILDMMGAKSQRLWILASLLSRNPNPKMPELYRRFVQKNGADPYLALAMIRFFIRLHQGEKAYAFRQTISQAKDQKYAHAFTQWDRRIIMQLMQEAQLAETLGEKSKAYRLYTKAVSVPILSGNDKTPDAHWAKGLIYWAALKDYGRALEHFVQSAPTIPAQTLRSKTLLLAQNSFGKEHPKSWKRHDVRALFWCGLCCESMGKKDLAKAYYTQAYACGTYFYGQWAAWKLQRPIHLNFAPTQANSKNWNTPGQKTAAWIVEIWKKYGSNGKNFPAYDTTLALCKDLMDLGQTSRDKAVALDMIAFLNPNYVVEAAKCLAQNSDSVFRMLYPILPTISYKDTALTHSIVLTESCFNLTAYSWTGAIGIMQIMPKTAEKAAKELGLVLDMQRLFKDQAYQIRLGTQVIEDYVKQMGGFYPAGIAAYNAGVQKVKPWVISTPHLVRPEDGLVWIESIPFAETHHYVLRVLEAYGVYRCLMGKPMSPKEAMHVMRVHPDK